MVKRFGIPIVVCAVLGALGVWLYTSRATDEPAGQPDPASLTVHLPATDEAETESLDSGLPAALDSEGISETSKALFAPKLAGIKETIHGLNRAFEEVTFGEVPEDFRLSMQPAADYEAHGRFVHYYTDEADNVLDALGIQDYGECTSTIAYDGEGAFTQSLVFNQPLQLYIGSHRTTSGEAFEAQTYQWKDTGAWEPPPDAERYLSLWPAKLDLFSSRKLSKGERVSAVLDDVYEATFEVLGCAEIAGHKTVVFEQRIPDCPIHEQMGVPPFKREVIRRFYLDIETSMPLRAENRVVSYFTDEHRNHPKLAGIPESGVQQNLFVYQVDL
ncbi:MAG: hypothetical protein JW741_08215 [Sedimentisphaerales bacterium]|nr:hypothetical protein [Sedimentisphaerales bacterium]